MPELATVRDLRRGQIVATARTLVAKEGLGALTIGALEERLPFSRGVITHHFRNKEDIVEAVLDSALAEIDASTTSDVVASATPHDQIRAVLRTKVHGFLSHPEATRILVGFWGQLATDPRVRTRNAALFRRYRGQATALFQAAGVPKPEVLGGLLVGNVIGIVSLALFEEGAIDVDASIDEAAHALGARLK